MRPDGIGPGITLALLTHAVKVDLPKVSCQPNLTKPDNVQLAIRADGAVAYRKVVEVMADAAKAGLTRIGFVTDPNEAR